MIISKNVGIAIGEIFDLCKETHCCDTERRYSRLTHQIKGYLVIKDDSLMHRKKGSFQTEGGNV